MRTIASKGFHTGSVAIYGLRRAVVDDAGAPTQVLERGEWKAIKNQKTILVHGPSAEVAAVRRAFTLFVKGGFTPTQIGRILTEEGWPAPSRRGWAKDLVWSLLRNPKYAGDIYYGRTTRGLSRRRARTPPGEWVVVPDAYEPIIPGDLFRLASALIDGRRLTFTDQDILEAIAGLQSRHGFVSRRLIGAQPELPSVSAIAHRFGSLANALALAGCPPQSGSDKRKLSLAATRPV